MNSWPDSLDSPFQNYSEFLDIGDRVVTISQARWPTLDVTERALLQLLAKLTRTGRAVVLLSQNGMIEDAMALHRNMLEGTINLVYALRLGPEGAMQRLDDWIALETIVRYEASDYYRGTELHSDAHEATLRQKAMEIRSRYSSAELKRLERHGVFPGSLRDRASAIGWEERYDLSYRTLSRNVHAADVVEMTVVASQWPANVYERMMEVRYALVCNEGRLCLAPLVALFDGHFATKLGSELEVATAQLMSIAGFAG